MKKSIFIAVLGMASAVASYGQGKILFNNYLNSTQTTGIFFGNGPLAGGASKWAGSEISAILLFGASTDNAISQLTAIGSPVAMATSLGYSSVSGGNVIGNTTGAGWFGNSQITIDSTAPGTTYAFAIEATGTYQSVVYTGFSAIVDGASQAAGVGIPVPNLPLALRNTSFAIVGPVPEPTTLALAGLGGLASLLMVRRKKA
jgi:hypothetical protein